MAIVSRGGQVIDPGAPQRDAQAQALGQLQQAGLQAGQLQEQQRATQLAALEEQANYLMAQFGGRAFEDPQMAPLMNQWAQLAGIDPAIAKDQLGWTPEQDRNYIARQAMLQQAYNGVPQQTTPTPTPPSGLQPGYLQRADYQPGIDFTGATMPDGSTAQPQGPPSAISSNVNLATPTQRLATGDQSATDAMMNFVSTLDNELGNHWQGVSNPRSQRRQILQQQPEMVDAVDQLLGGEGRLRATLENPTATNEEVREVLSQARQAARYLTARETRTTQQTTPLFEGPNSMLSRVGQLAAQAREADPQATPGTIANDVLRQVAPEVFGEDYVVRENGVVVGVRDESGAVWPIEQFNAELRKDTNNFYRMFGQLSGGEAEYLRSAAFAVADGQLPPEGLAQRVQPDGTLAPWGASSWGPQAVSVAGTTAPTMTPEAYNVAMGDPRQQVLEGWQAGQRPPQATNATAPTQEGGRLTRSGPSEPMDFTDALGLDFGVDPTSPGGQRRREGVVRRVANWARERANRDTEAVERQRRQPVMASIREAAREGRTSLQQGAAELRQAAGGPLYQGPALDARVQEVFQNYEALIEAYPDQFPQTVATRQEQRANEIDLEVASVLLDDEGRMLDSVKIAYRESPVIQNMYTLEQIANLTEQAAYYKAQQQGIIAGLQAGDIESLSIEEATDQLLDIEQRALALQESDLSTEEINAGLRRFAQMMNSVYARSGQDVLALVEDRPGFLGIRRLENTGVLRSVNPSTAAAEGMGPPVDPQTAEQILFGLTTGTATQAP